MIKSIFLDRFGICISVCCGIHCISTVFLLTYSTVFLHNITANQTIETVLSIVLLLVFCLSIPWLFVRKKYGLLLSFTTGFALVHFSETIDTLWLRLVLLVSGIFLILYTHISNIKLKRKYVFSKK